MCDGNSFKYVTFAPPDPCQMQDNWKLSEGFVAEEAKALLPHRATGRYNQCLSESFSKSSASNL